MLLRSCRLDSTAAGALHDALLGTPGLQLLSLQKAVCDSNNSNTSDSNSTLAGLFSPALAAHPALVKLELQQATRLQQHDWQQLGAYVAQAPLLQELLLQEAQLGPGAAAAFAAGLLQQQPAASPAPGLRVLDLSGCTLGPDAASAAAQLGAALGACCSKLAVLKLGQTELDGLKRLVILLEQEQDSDAGTAAAGTGAADAAGVGKSGSAAAKVAALQALVTELQAAQQQLQAQLKQATDGEAAAKAGEAAAAAELKRAEKELDELSATADALQVCSFCHSLELFGYEGRQCTGLAAATVVAAPAKTHTQQAPMPPCLAPCRTR